MILECLAVLFYNHNARSSFYHSSIRQILTFHIPSLFRSFTLSITVRPHIIVDVDLDLSEPRPGGWHVRQSLRGLDQPRLQWIFSSFSPVAGSKSRFRSSRLLFLAFSLQNRPRPTESYYRIWPGLIYSTAKVLVSRTKHISLSRVVSTSNYPFKIVVI